MDAELTGGRPAGDAGFTLVETLIAMLVLTVGALGMASVFLQGMTVVTSAPNELVATQKAAEAIESVFSARDSHTITWEQLQNTNDATGGIFLEGPKAMRLAGADGIVNTTDDNSQPVESVQLPGPDGQLGTADDTTLSLAGFTREIEVTELSTELRQVTVIIEYPAGNVKRTYTLTALISAFA